MITFSNGQSYATVAIRAGTAWYDGTFRRNLQVDLSDEEVDFPTVRALMTTPAALRSIVITENDVDGNAVGEFVHSNYTLGKSVRYGAGIFTLEIAQKTDAEVMIDALIAAQTGSGG